jgi:hypothetical protein
MVSYCSVSAVAVTGSIAKKSSAIALIEMYGRFIGLAIRS